MGAFLVVFFALLFVNEQLEFGSTARSIESNGSCIKSELKALVKFKQNLIDKSNRLSSWVGEDCCTWNGVGCSKRTGHVVKLDLRNPTSLHLNRLISTFYFDDANYSRTCLGGEINPSILNLKHLLYVDLSMNNFSKIKIPEFFGSLQSLRYLNLSSAGFGGKVPHHLGNLSNLQYLDLSRIENFNALTVDNLWWASTLSSLKYLDLGGVNLGEATDWLHAINMLPSLLELNLVGCQLDTIPPLSTVNFTSLASLDLQWNYINSTIPLWLSNISGLVQLRLDSNSFHGPIPDALGKLTSLKVLGLFANSLYTLKPNWLSKLSNLVYMDLRSNVFEGPILCYLGNSTSLEILELSSNSFNGSIPNDMGNITHLTVLDLSQNEFEGEIPNTMSNLCSLQVFDLSDNKFSGEIPGFVGSPSKCHQKSLKELSLGFNKLSGYLPDQLGLFENLERLILSSNLFRGPIPASLGRLSSLRMLDISGNHLNESIPLSFGQLSKLEMLDISNNSLAGLVFELHFAKLSRLSELHMSSNSLVLNVSSQWVPPFQLQIVSLESCKLGPQFPPWLQTQRHIKTLIMSNASISGPIPDWFEDLYSSIKHLDLSHNQISGKLPRFQESNDSGNLRMLILNSNKFEGPLTQFPSDVYSLYLSNNLLSGHIPKIDDNRTLTLLALILSNNYLTGAIPEFLCKIQYVGVIDLSRNRLSGGLPWCLGDLQMLEVLDLTNNCLNGDIPTFLGSLRQLKSLHLHNNRFHGKLPFSLQNLTNLKVLDLGENDLADTIPPWIGEKLYNLKFLNLKSNKFNGDIPIEICRLSDLQLLNLAQNNITGNIPHCFRNFTAMVVNHDAREYVEYEIDSLYQENILDSMKGIELKFTKTMTFLTSIDLSNNHIEGEIPEGLMDLFGLRSLNLAGNHLEGRIPEKIGNLEQLETLDLSRNRLSGSIPPSLSALHYLSRLNMSFNNLSGRIPMGNQLQTLDDQSIYIGNDGLCGLPLLKSCPGDESYKDDEQVGKNKDRKVSDFWLFFYAGIGPGFLIGFVGVCGILHLKKSWRYAFFQLVDNIYNNLVVAIEVKAAWVRMKSHIGEFRA
ncbi:hypothetical protein F0562_032525 [Nyssa sinensis]|uniref:Leucine-rich repeat-containing N-terminal plant-type domain-containing protein n=1 Tax=Nyssa sinensis TaxID=561372 RepID=A0A5J5AS03_9ASTE|nr:hypothetical protein F0562_032525 [Nyssa sinensis]